MGFKGLVISDDMVMGGVKNYYDSFDSCVKGIEAGIDIFIFRHSDEKTLNLIEKLCTHVENGYLPEEKINGSVKRILSCKKKFGLQNKKTVEPSFNPEKYQGKIDKIKAQVHV